MILNSPTIFGMKGNSLLAGGEAGSETVVGTQSLMDMIRDAVAAMAGGHNDQLRRREHQPVRDREPGHQGAYG